MKTSIAVVIVLIQRERQQILSTLEPSLALSKLDRSRFCYTKRTAEHNTYFSQVYGYLTGKFEIVVKKTVMNVFKMEACSFVNSQRNLVSSIVLSPLP